VAGYTPRWFTRPKTVAHPGTNRARRSVTTLIETNALPLSQTGVKVVNSDLELGQLEDALPVRSDRRNVGVKIDDVRL